MGDVIQFLYGEDGMDGTAVEGQKLDHLRKSEPEFRAMFLIDLSNSTHTPSWLKPDHAEELRSSIQAHQLLDAEYQVSYLLPALARGI